MNIYKYIYFGIYKLLLKTSAKEVAEIIASVWLSILVGMNFIFIIKCLGIEVREFLSLKVYFSLLYGILILINLYVFIWKKKYKTIIEHYSTEKTNRKNIRLIVTLCYIILSFLTIILF